MPDASQADLRAEARSRARADRTDRILSASAGVAAISALLVSVYQAYITRQQQKLSAWPYVVLSSGNVGGYRNMVQNAGLGPALVRGVRVTADGRVVRSWNEAGRAVLGDSAVKRLARDTAFAFVTNTLAVGGVLLPGPPLEMLHLSPRPGEVTESMQRASLSGRLVVRVCYCSLYGDCWTTRSDKNEPQPTPGGCAPDTASEFQ